MPTLNRGNPAQRTCNTVSPIGPDVKIPNLPSCEEHQCICIYFSRKCHISHSILTFENYRQTWNIIFTWFYLKFSSQSMKRTYTITTLFLFAKSSSRRHGFTGTGQLREEKCSEGLPTIWMPWKNQCLKSLRGQLEAGIHTWKKDQSRSRRVSKWDLPRRIWSRSGDGRNNSALRRPWPRELQTVWRKEEQSRRRCD